MDIIPPLRVDVLCERLGQRRGRPIRLLPYSLPMPGPFGLWLDAGTADYIVYQAETTRMHQDHIILHEVGHILADHESDDTDEDYWREAMPDLSPEMIRRALRRTHYDTDQEQQAELVATIIMEWASVIDHTTPRRVESQAAQRIQSALSDHGGWL
jgi:hypothetical protein